jgi:hypothetical protein
MKFTALHNLKKLEENSGSLESEGLLGRSIRDRKRGRKDPADIINGSTSENFLSNLSPFDAISFSNNGKNCGINVGKELRIFVLFAIRNSSVRSATIGSANSLLRQERKKVLKLPSASCRTASPKSRKNCRMVWVGSSNTVCIIRQVFLQIYDD